MAPSEDAPARRRGPPPLRDIELLDEDYAKVLRAKTPAERIAMGLEANRFVRLRLEGHLRTVHPDWSDGQIAAEIARRMLHGPG
jgi:hypothetical protein